MRKNVIIIGAGIGGLATAARLLKKGYKVKIVEKNSIAGGKTGFINSKGFTFDLTASIIMMPDEYNEIIKELNLNLILKKLEPNYKVFFKNGSSKEYSTDIESVIKDVEKLNISDGEGYLKFLYEGYKNYNNAYKYFLNRDFNSLEDLVNSQTLKGIIKTKVIGNSYDYIGNYIKNQQLQNFLAFQAMYIGVNPYEASNIYTLIPAISAIKGIWYMEGGMYSLIKALQGYIIANGGEIEFETQCQEIIIESKCATGIITNKGKEFGDIVICNSDFSYTIENLIKNKEYKEKIYKYDIGKKDYSCSVFMLYLGLRKKYDILQVHNLFLQDNFKESISSAFDGYIAENPSLYIYCPTRIDNTMAPLDKDLVNVMVRVPNLLKGNIKWDKEIISDLRNKIMHILKNIKGLEDIEDNVEYENYLTPMSFEKDYNTYGGCAFGLSHNLSQTAFLRPQNKAKDIENLYFIGDSIHPGTGVSLVLLGSSLLCKNFK